MTGELIPTGVTFGVGRNSINDAFSGTGEFNNIILDSGANFSGGTGGGKILSGGTDLYDIFISSSDGNDITRVQPGSNILTGGTANNPTISVTASPSFNSITASGSSVFTTLSATTIYSGGTPLSNIILSYSGASGSLWSASTGSNSIIANNGTGNVSNGSYSFVSGSGNTTNSNGSFIIGGINNIEVDGGGNFIIGGSDNYIEDDFTNATINSTGTANVRAITAPGRQHYLNTIVSSKDSVLRDSTGSTMISCSGITLNSVQWTTGMQRAYIDEYLDLNPQTTLPTPSQGRMFFSGSPLFKLMINTGGTSADWAIV